MLHEGPSQQVLSQQHSMQHLQHPQQQQQQQLPLHAPQLQPGASAQPPHGGLPGILPFGLPATPSDPFMHILGLPPQQMQQQQPLLQEHRQPLAMVSRRHAT